MWLVHLGHSSPVEAEAVQTLFAWLVDGVESGAGILLLSAVCKICPNTQRRSVMFHTILQTPPEPIVLLPSGPGSVGSVSKSDPGISTGNRSTVSTYTPRQLFSCETKSPERRRRWNQEVPGLLGRTPGWRRTCCWKVPGAESWVSASWFSVHDEEGGGGTLWAFCWCSTVTSSWGNVPEWFTWKVI